MGWADILLGSSNPWAQAIDANSNTFQDLGYGLATAPTIGQAFGAASQRTAQMEPVRYDRQLQQNALSLAAQQRNALADWAIKNGHPEWADAARAGGISGSDMFNEVNKITPVPQGDTLFRDGKPIAGSGPPPNSFIGNDEKTQSWNTVMAANAPGADPALKLTPKFQAAWSIINTPVQTPQGTYQPPIPANWGASAPAQATLPGSPGSPAMGAIPQPSPSQPPYPPPAGGAYPSPASASVGQDFPMVAPPANVQLPPGTMPGTQPFNESQSRITGLANMAIPDLKTALTHYPALTNLKDQALQQLSKFDPTGWAHGAQSAEYQQAYSATRSAISNILYTVSGAAIGDKEMERKIEDLTPQLGDKPPLVNDKLNRLADYVSSIANSTKDKKTIDYAQQALQGIQAAHDQINASANPSATPEPTGPPAPAGGGPVYIVNPQTGGRMMLQNGQWVPAS